MDKVKELLELDQVPPNDINSVCQSKELFVMIDDNEYACSNTSGFYST